MPSSGKSVVSSNFKVFRSCVSVESQELVQQINEGRQNTQYILILILMLKLELPQVMQPRSEAPNAGVRAYYFVPAHVGLLTQYM